MTQKTSFHILLFVLTVVSTLFMGSYFEGGDPIKDPWQIFLGFPYSFTLLAILGAHETGHYLVCRRYGVPATLPYFIPAPPPFILGTFGAVIKIKSRLPHRKALFDIGIAGPLSGLAIAIPACFLGLMFSEIKPIGTSAEGLRLGDSIIFKLISYLALGSVPANQDIVLNSIAFAGWFGILVTSFNLLPIGQLDGGHIIYAIIGEKAETLGKVLLGVLLVLGYFWPGWFFWAILLVILGFRHPPPVYDFIPLDKKRKLIGALMLLIFALTFIPVPISLE
ncbi:MAG: hypothetical protein A3C43_03080 [Candidatus Schekmanbacteria bacterium RIFCSPHIGHO2_02_FULL_38_11]|uniref:Peptidase M50 domain-containing protein n=1 Tax=Candidatus Schekmanbacteria bacterium RIFCSPLOWO2_12_FULL_38_15 TaxID=1817883 RepID=A0A1F7SED1_9BACT|nr:MAG: hypothetical protein A2043_01985 [Candidatus Schekmanbacteria bacterium GWA2_38_9]OGL49493.1 MAG: hypothetical protein A3H37_10335 [Candidatus Schekmanbacteria bacterium RIFCSPLOWO2_02_FULL_38_14]OGL52143.1 MAG: hypothetical protein A3G31_06915 [Candidatus Schekmanbacteria bacterium RIFCSPLOWO2_12_FULL_38_15]OGL53601.1 MAG: hypothetical protein A3C43_03080 [Candidatus Schekmanbacteria bacterium RIFCSPHIGHO2_02_FULL_38_11]